MFDKFAREFEMLSSSIEFRKINGNKSTGLDNVSNKLLLKLGADIVLQSTNAQQVTLYKGIYPNDWKLARVIPIHKSSTKHNFKKFLRELFIINFIKT